MREMLYWLAWEWINISVEYAAVAWMRLPRLFLAVIGVNLVTHPMLMLVLGRYGRDPVFVMACEVCVLLAEWLMLTVAYGRSRWRRTLLLAWLMNTVSYGVGILIDL